MTLIEELPSSVGRQSDLNLSEVPPELCSLIDTDRLDKLSVELPIVESMTFWRRLSQMGIAGGQLLHVGGDFDRSLAIYAQGNPSVEFNPLTITNLHTTDPSPQSYRYLNAANYRQVTVGSLSGGNPQGRVSRLIGPLVLSSNQRLIKPQFDLALLEPGDLEADLSPNDVWAMAEKVYDLLLKPHGYLFIHDFRLPIDEWHQAITNLINLNRLGSAMVGFRQRPILPNEPLSRGIKPDVLPEYVAGSIGIRRFYHDIDLHQPIAASWEANEPQWDRHAR